MIRNLKTALFFWGSVILVLQLLCPFAAFAAPKLYESHCPNQDSGCIQRELNVLQQNHHIPDTDEEVEYVYGGQVFGDSGVYLDKPTFRPLPANVKVEELDSSASGHGTKAAGI